MKIQFIMAKNVKYSVKKNNNIKIGTQGEERITI